MFKLAALTLALGAIAAPIEKRAGAYNVTDTTILQYALTLEHLENVFYTNALNKYSASDFANAGFPAWVRNRFMDISGDEASHVAFLTSALGSAAPAACTYNFPYTDVKSFVALAGIIENVGTAAYLGAAADITTPAYVTAAGAILCTEARHNTWIQSAADHQNPWSSPYETPLKYNGVYSLVTPFFVSCPSSNPSLPFMAYPSLTASSTTSGAMTQLKYNDTTTTEKYLITYYGLSVTATPINQDKTVMIPSNLQGTAYAVVSSSSNTTMVSPSTIVAGPLILFNPFNSATTNPMPANAGQ